MNKRISLNSLVFSDDKGVFVVREDYYLEFRDVDIAEAFIQARHKYWTDIYNIKLVFAEDKNETLADLEVIKVFRLVCKFLNVKYGDARGKSRKHEFIEAKRFAAIICIKRGKNRSAIYQFLDTDHSNLSHHEKQFRNYCKTDPNYIIKYEECEDYVLSHLKPDLS